jgi:hypothetical protein
LNITFTPILFSFLAKAQFLENPLTGKIILQWSLNKVSETFGEPIFYNNSSSLQYPFPKTLFLVALASGNRASELTNASRIGITDATNYVTIPVRARFLRKNQHLARALPEPIQFPARVNPERLCPAAALRVYI